MFFYLHLSPYKNNGDVYYITTISFPVPMAGFVRLITRPFQIVYRLLQTNGVHQNRQCDPALDRNTFPYPVGNRDAAVYPKSVCDLFL